MLAQAVVSYMAAIDDLSPLDGCAALAQQSPPAQRLFGIIGMMPNAAFGVSGLAIASAFGEPETAMLADALAGGGLLIRRPGDCRMTGNPVANRYALPPELRPLAVSAATAQQHGHARAVTRWYEWCLVNTSAAAAALYPHILRLNAPPGGGVIVEPTISGSDQASDWLDAELTTLTIAISSAPGLGRAPYAYLLADGLRGRGWQRPHATDWSIVAAAGLWAAQATGDERALAAMYMCNADVAFRSGDFAMSADACVSAEHHAARAGWLSGRASALANLGGLRHRQRRLDESLHLYTDALELFRATGRRLNQAAVWNDIGVVQADRGDPRSATAAYRQALTLYRHALSAGGEARTLALLAAALKDEGHHDAAGQAAAGALALYERLGDRIGEDRARALLARIEAVADRKPAA